MHCVRYIFRLTHPRPLLHTDADLAIAIQETCGDSDTQIECIDDSPDCERRAPYDFGYNQAFTTAPVSMVGGKTYSVLLGGWWRGLFSRLCLLLLLFFGGGCFCLWFGF
jgi:hypothetical protein